MNVQQRFGNNNIRAGSEGRMDFRGRGGDQLRQAGVDRSNLANRASVGGGTRRIRVCTRCLRSGKVTKAA